MKTLKKKTELSTDGLFRRYGGVPILYLEAEADRYIYAEIWFREYQNKIEFTAVDKASNAAGCKAVIDQVHGQRDQGNPAWGLVDRDALMAHNHWDLVWETDDAVYDASQRFGPYIKTTRCWELESYLADAEALEAYSARTHKRPKRSMDAVYDDLCSHCDALVPHAAYNAMAHQYQKSQLGDGMTDQFLDRLAVNNHIQTRILPGCQPQEQQAYTSNLGKVNQFSGAQGALPPQHFDSMKRRVHGKALLSRWARHNQWAGAVDRHIGHLAEEIAKLGRVPDELRAFVDTLSSNPA